MTRTRDLDRVLDQWLDDGPTVVADRVIATALTNVHSTRQRGARWALLKELVMTIKPAATLAVVAVIAVLGIAVYQFVWEGALIGGPSAPRIVAASELQEIVMNADEAPTGMNLDGIYTGDRDVLLRPIASPERPGTDAYLDQPGFISGRYTEFSNDQAGVLSWAALFATPEDAERALTLYAAEVESEEGHGLTTRVDVAFGDEGAFYSDGNDPEINAQVYLWRVGNLVLAAATYGEFDPDQLGDLAEGMDDRAG